MTRFASRRRFLPTALALGLTVLVSEAYAAPSVFRDARGQVERSERPAELLFAQGGCSAAAAQAEAQTGGRVLSVRMSQEGDRVVCVVTVLIPASDGNRPRRQTITIEQ